MIQILHNSKSESYKQLKKEILGTYFSWYYNGNTTNKDYKFKGHQNIYHFGHSFLVRPEEHGYSKPNSKHFPLAFNVVNEILSENGFNKDTYFFLRLNANCSLPIQGEQFSNPHVDHDFPHVNFLAEAREEDVYSLWQGLGYYNRAKNLHKTSKIISK